jgi:aspartate racemase
MRQSYTERRRVSWMRPCWRPEAVAAFARIIGRLKAEDGCEAVILGCTEIPLIMSEGNSPLPVLDSTRLLARAALRRAVDR